METVGLGGGLVPEYEIQVAGRIGPAAVSGLPGFTSVALHMATTLAGTVSCRDDLKGVIDLLTARGLAPIDVRITARDDGEQSIRSG